MQKTKKWIFISIAILAMSSLFFLIQKRNIVKIKIGHEFELGFNQNLPKGILDNYNYKSVYTEKVANDQILLYPKAESFKYLEVFTFQHKVQAIRVYYEKSDTISGPFYLVKTSLWGNADSFSISPEKESSGIYNNIVYFERIINEERVITLFNSKAFRTFNF